MLSNIVPNSENQRESGNTLQGMKVFDNNQPKEETQKKWGENGQ